MGALVSIEGQLVLDGAEGGEEHPCSRMRRSYHGASLALVLEVMIDQT